MPIENNFNYNYSDYDSDYYSDSNMCKGLLELPPIT